MDLNNDKLVDLININLKLPIKANKVKNIKFTFFFDYELAYSKYPLVFSSLGAIDVDTPIGCSYLKTIGKISLKQRSPISSASYSISDQLDNEKILEPTSPLDINEVKFQFANKNYTTIYDYTSQIIPFYSSKELEIDINVEIPNYQEVLFTAPYLYSFKIAWVQYFCILLPVSIFVYFIMLFIFRMGVLQTVMIKEK